MSDLKAPFSVIKGERAKIGGYSFRPYLILDCNHQVFWFVTDFLRYLGERGVDEKSMYNDATRLCKFFSWVYLRGGSYFSVDDNTLHEYRAYLAGYERTSLSSYFRTIIQCYAVGQELGYVSGHIGESSYVDKRYVKLHVTSKSKQRPRYNNITWLYAPRVRSKAPSIPLTANINALLDHILLRESSHAMTYEIRQRDYLLVRWMKDAFLREAEVVGLRLSDIPSRESLNASSSIEYGGRSETASEAGSEQFESRVPVTLVKGCKFGKKRTVHVPASLIWETRDYIDNDRLEITRYAGNRRSNALFPSVNHGGHLTSNYIPHLLKDYCSNLEFNIKPHDLRKYGITRLIYLRIVDAENKQSGTHSRESIIYEVSQMAGHSDVKTTETYYLDLKKMGGYFDSDTLKRDLSNTNLFQSMELERLRVRKLQAEVNKLKKKLKNKNAKVR